MRNWMRERMKRRKKKPENETEATGKVGQQKPLVDEAHPQPLMPAYDDVEPEAPRAPEAAQEPQAANAFGDAVGYGLRRNRLAVKFLFQPGSTQFTRAWGSA